MSNFTTKDKRLNQHGGHGLICNWNTLTVHDGTNDLMNLADPTGLSAGPPGREYWKRIESERLESASSDGRGSSTSSPPESPG